MNRRSLTMAAALLCSAAFFVQATPVAAQTVDAEVSDVVQDADDVTSALSTNNAKPQIDEKLEVTQEAIEDALAERAGATDSYGATQRQNGEEERTESEAVDADESEEVTVADTLSSETDVTDQGLSGTEWPTATLPMPSEDVDGAMRLEDFVPSENASEVVDGDEATEPDTEALLSSHTDEPLPVEDPAVLNDHVIHYYATTDQFMLDGEVLVNQWVDYLGGRYFTTSSGTVHRSTFLTYGDQGTYYAGATGLMLTGKREIQGELYYLTEEGEERGRLVQSNDWVETAEGRIYPRADGRLYRNQFITFGAKVSYYMGNDGLVVSGMVKADGTVYRMTGTGGQRLIESSAYVYEGKEYYSDAKGNPYRDRVVTVGGKDYYYGKDGAKVYQSFTLGDYEYKIDSKSGVLLSVEEIKKEPTLPREYTLSDLRYHGVIYWGGYKFTYYSQRVLPGGGLKIPGRHVNEAGYVADGDGYIVLANDAPKGTIIPTPFGYYGKVYDRGTYGNHYDVYTM